MQAKFKVILPKGIYAVLTLKLELPSQQELLAEAIGIGQEEQKNLLGQYMAELINLLGNTDET